MKRILMFAALKLAEAAGLCGIALGFAWIGFTVQPPPRWAVTFPSIFYSWEAFRKSLFDGIYVVILFIAALFVLYGIWRVIKANWKWAGKFCIPFALALLLTAPAFAASPDKPYPDFEAYYPEWNHDGRLRIYGPYPLVKECPPCLEQGKLTIIQCNGDKLTVPIQGLRDSITVDCREQEKPTRWEIKHIPGTDAQINQWLDEHPGWEPVSSSGSGVMVRREKR